MGNNFHIILPGNGWFSSKLNKTYCILVNFYCKWGKQIEFSAESNQFEKKSKVGINEMFSNC